MPSLNLYKNMYGGLTIGQAFKNNSDKIMEATWDNDISTRDIYFYDWYHDDYKTQLDNLNPINDKNKALMRCKFLMNSVQTMDKDAVTFHLQLLPSQECVVPYYDEYFANRYNAHYPVGLYCDIPDEKGQYNRWLVVGEANYNVTQFPTFELLRCDYILQVVIDNVKYQFPVVLRSQSS